MTPSLTTTAATPASSPLITTENPTLDLTSSEIVNDKAVSVSKSSRKTPWMIVSILMMVASICIIVLIVIMIFKQKKPVPYQMDDIHSESTNEIFEAMAPESDVLNTNDADVNTFNDPFMEDAEE